MVDEKNKNVQNDVAKDKKSVGKTTLSLSLNVDVNKVLENKQKKIKGRTTVEVKTSKIKEVLVEEKQSSKTVILEDAKEVLGKVEEDGASQLTEQERSLRLQILEQAEDKATKDSPEISLGSFTVVAKENNKREVVVPVASEVQGETVKEEKNENSPQVSKDEEVKEDPLVIKKPNVIMARPEVKAPVVANVKTVTEYEDKDTLEEEQNQSKKGKKKNLGEENKRNILPNLKNVDIAYVVNEEDDEEDDILEDSYDEEKESESTVVEEKKELDKTTKFTHAVKRKNKKRDAKIHRDKIIKEIELSDSLTVRDLAIKLAEKSFTLIKELEKMGIKSNEKKLLDLETAELVAIELGHKVQIIDKGQIEKDLIYSSMKEEDLITRSPVVTIMGHVDHGKTTLLDTIRKTNVVDKESGGITQHIGAYQIKTDSGQHITFLDTPGHEAFSQIRARGSKITDIVVLVVAADDGVKQQTIEAINHAKLAEVPIILAINKIDKLEKNPQKVKTELLQHNIVVEEMGGDVLTVEISAKNNIGIDKLLETILLQAEMLDLKTSDKASGKASVIEVRVEKGFGVLATVLVERGTIKVGDIFVCGNAMGKIKVMINDKGQRLKVATSSMPVEISGFDGVVEAGDDFVIVPSESKATELINYRLNQQKIEKSTNKGIHYFLSDNIENIKVLPVIVKADTQGSIEAILGSLNKIIHKDLEIKIVHSGVGEINESDIMLTTSSKGVVIGFNVRANNKARDLAKKEAIDVRYHSIIYKLIDDVKLILSGLLDPNIVEKIIGNAEVREVFSITKVGKIAGCYVKDGILKRSAYVRLLRDNVVIHSGVLSQLKRFKDDVKEVSSNFECGVAIENYHDIKVGDIIECYEKTEVRETIE